MHSTILVYLLKLTLDFQFVTANFQWSVTNRVKKQVRWTTQDILVGRPEGRRPLGRPRHRWDDNIKMDLREIGFGDNT
jgi:hypothetical protein